MEFWAFWWVLEVLSVVGMRLVLVAFFVLWVLGEVWKEFWAFGFGFIFWDAYQPFLLLLKE